MGIPKQDGIARIIVVNNDRRNFIKCGSIVVQFNDETVRFFNEHLIQRPIRK